MNLVVPDWLQAKCDEWQARLRMQEWEIELAMSLAPNDDPSAKALAEQYQDINYGRITFRADIEDNEDGEKTIVHEMLHIKHSRVDDVIARVLEPHVSGVPTTLVDSIYRIAMEPFIDSMAQALVAMARSKA